MKANIINIMDWPDWYLTEKHTNHIISQLTTIQELDFYLKNPDPYIRRQAILRINTLCLKDCIEAMKDIMEDPTEVDSNKDIAAWTLKKICSRHRITLFYDNDHMSTYSGTELLNELAPVTIVSETTSLKYNLPSRSLCSQLEDNDSRFDRDICIDTTFPLAGWLKACSSSTLNILKIFLLKTPRHVFRLVKVIFNFLLITFPQRALSPILRVMVNPLKTWHRYPHKGDSLKGERREKHAPHQRKSNEVSVISSNGQPLKIKRRLSIRKTVTFCRGILCYPFIILLRHKGFAFAVTISIYCLLAFTAYGKTFTNQYIGFELADAHPIIHQKAMAIVALPLQKIQEDNQNFEIINKDDMPQNTEKETQEEVIQKQIEYRVIAKNGLNLRSEPNASNNNIITTIPYNAIVWEDYNMHSDHQAWNYIHSSNGNSGWAYSKWLEETGDVNK